jgi:asparagine synthase (glutamine-hydrolysing)
VCGFVTIHGPFATSIDNISATSLMIQGLRHRGPDGHGAINVDGMLSMRHCRLSIIDHSGGSQPMTSQGGRYSLVYNGEIYNYLELRSELEKDGVQFRTHSDVEVLLELLIRKKEHALRDLNGMFSFVFHDRNNDTWIAGRDPVGIKPLYYFSSHEYTIFSSEIKALIAHPLVSAKLNSEALSEYFTFHFVFGDRTLFQGINKVAPGTTIIGESSQIKRVHKYWDLNLNEFDHPTNFDAIEEIRSLLEDSVKLQMRSDAPVGAYLSGGLDSSLIASMASRNQSSGLLTFHGSFLGIEGFDESNFAQLVATKIDSTHHELNPTPQDFVEVMPKLIYSLDEPAAGPGAFPQYLVSALASKHVKVILGGQGGDEIFGGYARYLIAYLEQAIKGAIMQNSDEANHVVTLKSIIPRLAMLKEYAPILKSFFSSGFLEPMQYRYFELVNRAREVTPFLEKDYVPDPSIMFQKYESVFNSIETDSYINKMLGFDFKTHLQSLLHVEDRVSMAHGLESRVPFLDIRLIDYVSRLSPSLKFGGNHSKYLLREVSRGILPDAVIDRRDKMGFPVPLAEWYRTGLIADFVGDVLFGSASRNRGILNVPLFREALEKGRIPSRQLWGSLSLELWFQIFIDCQL